MHEKSIKENILKIFDSPSSNILELKQYIYKFDKKEEKDEIAKILFDLAQSDNYGYLADTQGIFSWLAVKSDEYHEKLGWLIEQVNSRIVKIVEQTCKKVIKDLKVKGYYHTNEYNLILALYDNIIFFHILTPLTVQFPSEIIKILDLEDKKKKGIIKHKYFEVNPAEDFVLKRSHELLRWIEENTIKSKNVE